MRAIMFAWLLVASCSKAAHGQNCYPEHSGYYSAPYGGEMNLHPSASSALVRVVSFEAMAEIEDPLNIDYLVGGYELEILTQSDVEGQAIDRENWPFETLYIQGVDYPVDDDREAVGDFVMRNVIVFRSEFMAAHICGWRPYLNPGSTYDIRVHATFRHDTFTLADN